jgi:hypothetical protein
LVVTACSTISLFLASTANWMVLPNADLGMRGYGAAVGIGQRDLVLAG